MCIGIGISGANVLYDPARPYPVTGMCVTETSLQSQMCSETAERCALTSS